MGIEYTQADAGCYIDGAPGIYAIDAIIAFAEGHGYTEPGCSHRAPGICSECADDIEDECDDYMNEHCGVDGYYWGRSDAGDWGLWPSEDDS